MRWLPVGCRVDFNMAPPGMAAVSWSPSTVVVMQLRSATSRTYSDVLRRTATMETGALQLQVRSCKTAFQLICGKLIATEDMFVQVLTAEIAPRGSL